MNCETFKKKPSYMGICDKCKNALGNIVGAIMGPDREDDTEEYLYELCNRCAEEYNQKMYAISRNFIVEYLNIPPSNFSTNKEQI
jgi:hypothetical protein